MDQNEPKPNKSPAKIAVVGLFLLVAALGIGSIMFLPSLSDSNQASVGSSGAVSEGEHQLKVPIEIDTGGRTINAAEVRLTFDPKVVEVIKVTKEKSFFKIWITDSPSFSNKEGTVTFSGGVFNPGFTGKGQVGAVVLKAKQRTTTELRFAPGTQVLLNDGKGTPVPLELNPIKVELP